MTTKSNNTDKDIQMQIGFCNQQLFVAKMIMSRDIIFAYYFVEIEIS